MKEKIIQESDLFAIKGLRILGYTFEDAEKELSKIKANVKDRIEKAHLYASFDVFRAIDTLHGYHTGSDPDLALDREEALKLALIERLGGWQESSTYNETYDNAVKNLILAVLNEDQNAC